MSLVALFLLVGCPEKLVPPEDSGTCTPTAWFRDNDGDGFGDADRGSSTACDPPEGYAAVDGDCDDVDAEVHPHAMEICDGVDDDCDGAVDEDVSDATFWFADTDGDGYGDAAVHVAGCDAPVGFVANDDDCDDASATIAPEAVEVCDGVDQDCDGEVDDAAIDAPTWYGDADADGYGDYHDVREECDMPSDAVDDPTDCDDLDPDVHPGAAEVCDDADQDCDGRVDEDAVDAPAWYSDGDGDGYGDRSLQSVGCDAPAGTVSDATDCDDTDAAISPAGIETCASPADDDCDGDVDEADAVDAPAWYADADGDGFGDASVVVLACTKPVGFVADATDCADSDASISPTSSWYADADGDGFGDASVATQSCTQPPGTVADATDCDDTDATISPAGTETCASPADDDCDGTVDEGAADVTTWYLDGDIDGRGDPAQPYTGCTRPYGYVADATDCDDTDAYAHPGATETCYTPGDEDCDGDANELGALGCTDFYLDLDGDGYGSNSTACYCTGVAPYSATRDTDCDDADSTVHPGGTEVEGNGVDEDCYGGTDIVALVGRALAIRGAAVNEGAGYAEAAAGDVDGDGYGDVWVSSSGTGTISLLAGPFSADRSTATAGLVIADASGAVVPGAALAGRGDSDGDGVLEVLIGGEAYGAGAVFLLDGTGAGAVDLLSGGLEIDGASAGDSFGVGVAFVGDQDGDGDDEVAIGASGVSGAATGAGAVYLYTGSPVGTGAADAGAVITGTLAGEALGTVIRSAGDTDGDGIEDLLLGVPAWRVGAFSYGAAFLVLGPVTSGDLTSVAMSKMQGTSSNSGAGTAVAGPGDVDGDGYDDLLVGAPRSYTSGVAGRAYLVRSPAPTSMWLSSADTVFEPTGSDAQLGNAVAGIGDRDGDGAVDVAIASGNDATGGTHAGAVHLFYGVPTGTVYVSSADATYTGQAGEYLAGTLANAGDTDGDGYDDLLIGAPYNDDVFSNAGAVWVLTGP